MEPTLLPARQLERYELQAVDDEIGHLRAFYFETPTWAIRYLVVKTSRWSPSGRAVISPVAVGGVDEKTRVIHIELMREQIEHSPQIGERATPSREEELDYYRYYGWPPYWYVGPALPFVQEPLWARARREAPDGADGARAGRHLTLSSDLAQYILRARDDGGEIGRVRDFIVDTAYWAVRYIEVATGVWLPGRHVLVHPAWIAGIDDAGRAVQVDVRREVVESAPPYDPDRLISRDYEVRLFSHYGRETYWQRQQDRR
jgi:hypothetical protein